jgi:uncharacterized protein YcbK (DUF882 family)
MQTLLARRDLMRLGTGAVLGAAVAAPTMAWAGVTPLPGAEVRKAVLHNLHTGDTFSEVYFENGRYVPQALAEAMRVLRDWRNGEEHVMDPRLFDALHAINAKLETNQPFQIISGYRSPETNAAMHAKSSGVASNSQHTYGKASDVRVQGVDLRNLHKAALSVSAGGVGFYPVSNFVHVDVARVRQWTGV